MVDQKKLTPEIKAKLAARDRARTDKLFLAKEVLGYDFTKETHSELFEQYIPFNPELAWVEQSDVKNRIILWPRGHFKTTSIIVEIIQAILNFPDIRILVMQGTIKTTRGLLREIAAHFLGTAPCSKLSELFPEFCGNKKALQLTADAFTTPARKKKQLPQATISCASPKATKTGQHYDVGFFDDLINDQNYRSATQLQKAEENFKMCQPLIDPGGYRYVTGTRYVFGDLYENILRHNTGEWVYSVKTCWLEDGKTPRFPQQKTEDGRYIGFTAQILLQIQRDDPIVFASQYLNQPLAEGKQLFTETMMLGACVLPDKVPTALSQTVLFVDLASTDAAYSDDSVIVAGRMDASGNMYVVDVRGDTWLTADLAIHVIDMALKHRPLKIMFEKTASCRYFVDYLKMFAHQKGIVLPIDFISVDNRNDAKYMRISGLQAYINNRRLFFFVGIPSWPKMVEQFTHFPKAHYGHDDYPDTVALMANEFNKNAPIRAFAGSRNPLTHMILNEGTDITKTVLEERKVNDNQMGSDFCY